MVSSSTTILEPVRQDAQGSRAPYHCRSGQRPIRRVAGALCSKITYDRRICAALGWLKPNAMYELEPARPFSLKIGFREALLHTLHLYLVPDLLPRPPKQLIHISRPCYR